jgi:hypothetical protein
MKVNVLKGSFGCPFLSVQRRLKADGFLDADKGDAEIHGEIPAQLSAGIRLWMLMKSLEERQKPVKRLALDKPGGMVA